MHDTREINHRTMREDHLPSASGQPLPLSPQSVVMSPSSSALLLIDGVALEMALNAFFPNLPVTEHEILLPELIRLTEATFGLTFTRRIYHEATKTGVPSSLAKLMMERSSFTCRTKAMQAKAGTPVDPDTLEPLAESSSAFVGGEVMTLLVEAGLDVALSMDLLRYAGPGGDVQVAVVVTHRPELAEALDMVATRGSAGGGEGTEAYVCGLGREIIGTPLQKRVKSGVSLESMLSSAAEALWTNRDHHRRRTSGRGGSAPVLYRCPDWDRCGHIKFKAREGAGGAATTPSPFTSEKLHHLSRYQHPCLADSCRTEAVGPYHHQAWVHASPRSTAITPSSLQHRPSSTLNRRLIPNTNSAAAMLTMIRGAAAQQPKQHLHNNCPTSGASSTTSFKQYTRQKPCWGEMEGDEDWEDIVRFAFQVQHESQYSGPFKPGDLDGDLDDEDDRGFEEDGKEQTMFPMSL